MAVKREFTPRHWFDQETEHCKSAQIYYLKAGKFVSEQGISIPDFLASVVSFTSTKETKHGYECGRLWTGKTNFFYGTEMYFCVTLIDQQNTHPDDWNSPVFSYIMNIYVCSDPKALEKYQR